MPLEPQKSLYRSTSDEGSTESSLHTSTELNLWHAATPCKKAALVVSVTFSSAVAFLFLGNASPRATPLLRPQLFHDFWGDLLPGIPQCSHFWSRFQGTSLFCTTIYISVLSCLQINDNTILMFATLSSHKITTHSFLKCLPCGFMMYFWSSRCLLVKHEYLLFVVTNSLTPPTPPLQHTILIYSWQHTQWY